MSFAGAHGRVLCRGMAMFSNNLFSCMVGNILDRATVIPQERQDGCNGNGEKSESSQNDCFWSFGNKMTIG